MNDRYWTFIERKCRVCGCVIPANGYFRWYRCQYPAHCDC